MSRDEWKQAGTDMGHAFRDLGKTMVRSADRVLEKAREDDSNPDIVDEPNSTVFSDGTWKKTFKGLGKALVEVGDATVNSVSEVFDDKK